MGAALPNLGADRFERRLRAAVAPAVDTAAVGRLFTHYEELRRWNPRLSLIGPGTAVEVVERHYGESLAALPLVVGAGRLVDLGSGAGFPGLPLAVALPDLEVWLVEPRQRKWAFLRSATAAAGVRCHFLAERVANQLPDGFPDRIDVVTLRALKLDTDCWKAVRDRLSAKGRVLWWGGTEKPEGLVGWVEGRQIRLGGRERRILELLPPDAS